MKNERYYIRTKDGRIYATSDPSTWHEAETLTRKAGEEAYRAQAKADLLEFIKPGSTIYCILRHVSASGMSRRISLVVMQDGKPRNITGTAAAAMASTLNRDEFSIVVNGCGMDMGFHLVSSLGCRLWPKGTPEPHGSLNGTPNHDGGYALKHEWL